MKPALNSGLIILQSSNLLTRSSNGKQINFGQREAILIDEWRGEGDSLLGQSRFVHREEFGDVS